MSLDSIMRQKSLHFAQRIVRLYQYMVKEHHETVMSRQILRSGTSIGANISEGIYGSSKKDFANKLHIALKEASENKTKLTAAEASIQAKDQEIASLKAQIEELNKQPGDSTTHPVNDGGSEGASPMDSFIERVNAAQKLYDLV